MQRPIHHEDTEATTLLNKSAPQVHSEKHSKHSEYMRDAIIGFADGLTVPFALTAGLSAVGSIRVVIVGGRHEVRAMPEAEEKEIYDIFGEYHIPRDAVKPIFMMDFELKLECPKRSRAWIAASVMGLSYFIGGLIPMLPYFFFKEIMDAFFTSIGITVVILLVFGYIKATVTGCTRSESFVSALQTLFVGALAAATSYGIVRLVNSKM
ncbi:DUF125-domain-containing protein [Tothia fuscella]|uniref:DUF125-domain-containing protein n=1 Tax=Tothia fuscella TaxID=1048955 RepID=A0A9P4NM68_9PEZI|nr:DUF125-domain-containing protein [Tothia fuscella]